MDCWAASDWGSGHLMAVGLSIELVGLSNINMNVKKGIAGVNYHYQATTSSGLNSQEASLVRSNRIQ